MKKHRLMLLAIAFMCLVPFTGVKAISTCSPEDIKKIREQLSSFDIVYEVVPKNTKAYNRMLSEEIDVSNMIKISFSNLPENFSVSIDNIDGNAPLDLPTNSEGTFYSSGGIYNIRIGHPACLEAIKSFDIMIPLYNSSNKDVWFDGTYEQKTNNTLSNIKKNVSSILIVIMAVLLIIIVGFIIFVFRKKRVQ